jgi:hypothetical protein
MHTDVITESRRLFRLFDTVEPNYVRCTNVTPS